MEPMNPTARALLGNHRQRGLGPEKIEGGFFFVSEMFSNGGPGASLARARGHSTARRTIPSPGDTLATDVDAGRGGRIFVTPWMGVWRGSQGELGRRPARTIKQKLPVLAL